MFYSNDLDDVTMTYVNQQEYSKKRSEKDAFSEVRGGELEYFSQQRRLKLLGGWDGDTSSWGY